MTTHYNGSRGPMEIAAMPFPYLRNARDKLARERIGDERQDELDAMTAQIDKLEVEYAEQLAEQAVTGHG